MRRTLLFLVLAVACGGSDKSSGPATGLGTVASVTISAPVTTISVGQSVTLTASALDASGNVVTGQAVTWASLAPSVASVTTAGVVTGMVAGQATITATAGGKSGQVTMTIAQAVASCTSTTPLALSVGQPHTLLPAERQAICIAGGTTGSEYALIAFNDAASGSANIPTAAVAANTAAPTVSPSLTPGGLTPLLQRVAALHATAPQLFNRHLRDVERTVLAPRIRAKGGRGAAALLSLMKPGALSPIVGLAAAPAVGTMVTLNANGVDACDNPTNRRARVAAVSKQAIVVADSTNPAGGFTDADYLSIATTFDTLVWPLDTTAFGAPSDFDNNGHVILFFTNTVNALTPPNSDGIIGGFFFSRDLFPQVGNATIDGCPASNVGEMFYLPVVDPNGVYNPFFKSKDTLVTDIIGTLAHEFQHLINGSRRVYITNATDFEEVWLNEGMSHIAEELLYYRVSGFAPKQNLGFQATVQTASATQYNALNSYQVENLGRLALYLSATDINSPYAENDSLETRGATWELLRYCLDQSTTASNTLLHALVNSPNTGKTNFDATFAGVGGLTTSVRNQVIANFFDDTAFPLGATYTFPSWNYRDLLIHFSGGPSSYQLQAKPLTPGTTQTFSLTPGGSGYMRFHVNGSTTAGVAVTSAGAALPASVELILVRMQ